MIQVSKSLTILAALGVSLVFIGGSCDVEKKPTESESNLKLMYSTFFDQSEKRDTYVGNITITASGASENSELIMSEESTLESKYGYDVSPDTGFILRTSREDLAVASAVDPGKFKTILDLSDGQKIFSKVWGNDSQAVAYYSVTGLGQVAKRELYTIQRDGSQNTFITNLPYEVEFANPEVELLGFDAQQHKLYWEGDSDARGRIYIADTVTQTIEQRDEMVDDRGKFWKLSPTYDAIYYVDDDDITLKRYNLNTREITSVYSVVPTEEKLGGFTIAPSGKTIALTVLHTTPGQDGQFDTITIVDVQTNTASATIDEFGEQSIAPAVWSPHSDYVWFDVDTGDIRKEYIYHLQTQQLTEVFKQESENIKLEGWL